MASFVGNLKEFRRFIGPRLRNLVQQITKNHKSEISACEHCGSQENLESAHVHGRDRNQIIDFILTEFMHNDIATVNLEVFEEIFINEHQPLEKSILILCRSCHLKYGTQLSQPTQENVTALQPKNEVNFLPDNTYGYLPITLDPANPDVFKKALLDSKQAEIETFYKDGKVERKLWKAAKFSLSSNVFGNLRSRPEYRSGNWQKMGIVKVHARVVNNTLVQKIL